MGKPSIGRLPWKAVIWQHAGQPDTVCIKDADDNEIVSWTGFDGVPGTKAQIRERARMIVRAVNRASYLVLSTDAEGVKR